MLPLFFLVWIIFNGRVTLEIVLFGIAISGLMFAFVCKFMDYSMEKERKFYKKFPLFCKYAVLLVKEIIKSANHASLFRKDIEPDIRSIPVISAIKPSIMVPIPFFFSDLPI